MTTTDEAPIRTGFRQFIAGTWSEPAGSGTVPITDPATGRRIAEVPAATVEEADAAIAAAHRAFHSGPWPRLSQEQRAAALSRFAGALDARRDELVEIAIRQTGATRTLAEGLQVGFSIDAAHRYARLAATFPLVEHTSLSGPPVDGGPRRQRIVVKAPAGVVVGITPFNYPLMMNVQKVFPSLAMGCTTVLKPTPDACLDAVVLAEAAEEADLPEGVLSVLLGAGPAVGERLVTSPDVDVVTFTGSTATGRRIMALGAETIKRVVLELGGKSANIVFADADLDAFFATDPANLRHAGQGCGQLTRILVQRPVYDEVVERMAARMRQVRIGDPSDPETELGPVVSDRQRQRILGYIERAVAGGARLVCGGGTPEDLDGWFIEPTLFADVDNDMEIARDEIFGPVLVAIPFDDEADAIRIAEDSPYGINGAVWTADVERAWRVAHGVRTGNFGINCLANVMEGPHGGFKQTGNGREWWEHSMHEYVELRGFTVAGGAA